MARSKSRFTPRNPHWYEDLPERTARYDTEIANKHTQPDLPNALNHIDDVYLEVSRAAKLNRGIGLTFLPLLCVIEYVCVFVFDDFDLILMVAIFFFLYMAMLFARMDLGVPTDQPSRFNRHRKKVYVYEYNYSALNFFGRWGAEIKAFDWDNIQAEVVRESGTTGRGMITAYFLELAVCKPGTTEVTERFRMTGMKPGPNQPTQIWGFIRRYMAEGPAGVPDIPERPRDLNFRRSLFTYARFVDPSEDGRAWRAKSNGVELAMMFAVSPIILPLVLPAGIGHYIAMRFAPEAHFPPDIEAESTSA